MFHLQAYRSAVSIIMIANMIFGTQSVFAMGEMCKDGLCEQFLCDWENKLHEIVDTETKQHTAYANMNIAQGEVDRLGAEIRAVDAQIYDITHGSFVGTWVRIMAPVALAGLEAWSAGRIGSAISTVRRCQGCTVASIRELQLNHVAVRQGKSAVVQGVGLMGTGVACKLIVNPEDSVGQIPVYGMALNAGLYLNQCLSIEEYNANLRVVRHNLVLEQNMAISYRDTNKNEVDILGEQLTILNREYTALYQLYLLCGG